MTASIVILAFMLAACAAYLVHQWWTHELDPDQPTRSLFTPVHGRRRPRLGRQINEQPWRLDVTHLRDATPRTGRR